TLVLTDSDGREARQELAVDPEGNCSLEYKVPGDFGYRVEAGADPVSASPTYRVTAVTPVELAPDSPAIRVTPPPYARAALDEETFHGLVDLSALRHSQVTFAFRFSRPAVAAALEW